MIGRAKCTLILLYLIIPSSQVYSQPTFVIDTILLPNQVIKKISTGMSNDVWVIEDTTNRGVYRIDEYLNVYDHSTLMQSQTSSAFTAILNFDVDEAILGTEDDFLFHFQAGSVTKIDSTYGFNNNAVNSIVGSNSSYNFYFNRVYAGTGDSAYISLDGYNYTNYNTSADSIVFFEIDKYMIFQNIGSYRLSKYNFNANRYLSVHTSSTVYSLNLSLFSLSGINTATFYNLSAGSFKYYVGTDNGLSILYNNAQTDLLSGQKVNKLLKYNNFDVNQKYVLAGSDSGLYIAQEYDWAFSKINFPGYNFTVYDIAKKDFCFWLATDIGVIKIKDSNCTNMYVDFVFGDTTLSITDSCGIAFTASCSQCYDSLIWDFGDGQFDSLCDPVHTYSQSGNYTVLLEAYNGSCYDSATKTLNVIQCCDSTYYPSINLGQDTTRCSSDTILLTVNGQNSQILWSTGETDSIIEITATGTIWVQISNADGCTASDTINIEVIQPPLSLGNDITICENAVLVLDAGSGYSAYLWSDSTTSQELTVDSSGIYYVEVTDTNSCTNIDSIAIDEYSLPNIDIGPDTGICEEYVLSAGPGFSTYLWSDNSSDSSLLVNSTGNYWIEVIDNNNCTQSDTVDIIIFPVPVIDLGGDTSVCEADSFILSVVGYTSYLWSDGGVLSDLTVTVTDMYWVQIIDSNTCTSSDTIEVNVFTQPEVDLGKDTIICSDGSLLLSAVSPGASYLWNDGSIGDTYLANETESIWVLVSNGSCIVNDSIMVQVNPIPVQVFPTYIELCTDSNGAINAGNSGANYLWSTGETSMTITVENIGDYSVLVTNQYNCELQMAFEVVVCSEELVIPNTITPNADGTNDTWEIDRIEDFPGNTVQIYNRNGTQVYETENYDNSWDGTWNNKFLPAASYFYILDLSNGAELIKGTLTIIRE